MTQVFATVDSIIVVKNQVLLIKRGKNPYIGHWAFPGGRIEHTDKDILDAAYRELKEETSISNVTLEYVKTIGNSSRDPRGFCITCIFMCILDEIPSNICAMDDAVAFKWFDLHDLPTMAFDHKDILTNLIIDKGLCI